MRPLPCWIIWHPPSGKYFLSFLIICYNRKPHKGDDDPNTGLEDALGSYPDKVGFLIGTLEEMQKDVGDTDADYIEDKKNLQANIDKLKKAKKDLDKAQADFNAQDKKIQDLNDRLAQNPPLKEMEKLLKELTAAKENADKLA